MKSYRQIAEQTNYTFFLLTVALLPFPQIALRYAVTGWLITWLWEGRWLRLSNLKQRLGAIRISIPLLLFGAWFAWKAISYCWSPDKEAWNWQMERYMAFAFMVPVALWGVNSLYDWRQAGKVLAISCTVALPAYLVWMTVLFRHPEYVPYNWLAEEWVQHDRWLTFFPENISHFKHRLFLSSVELAGIIAAIQVWREKKYVLAATIPCMLCLILLSGSRQSILTLAGLIAVGVLCMLSRTYRWRYGLGILMLGVIVGGSVLSFHPRMQEFDMSDITEMREVSYEHDIRFNIWGFALQHPQDYLAYGLGAGQSKGYMDNLYRETGFDYYAVKHYHAHNQYLEELMEIGIGGFLLFLLAWVAVPICAQNEGRRTAMLFTTLFMLNMCTDCMFGKFDGIALWAVGMLVVLLQSDPQREQ